jgi:hypothetical protein
MGVVPPGLAERGMLLHHVPRSDCCRRAVDEAAGLLEHGEPKLRIKGSVIDCADQIGELLSFWYRLLAPPSQISPTTRSHLIRSDEAAS